MPAMLGVWPLFAVSESDKRVDRITISVVCVALAVASSIANTTTTLKAMWSILAIALVIYLLVLGVVSPADPIAGPPRSGLSLVWTVVPFSLGVAVTSLVKAYGHPLPLNHEWIGWRVLLSVGVVVVLELLLAIPLFIEQASTISRVVRCGHRRHCAGHQCRRRRLRPALTGLRQRLAPLRVLPDDHPPRSVLGGGTSSAPSTSRGPSWSSVLRGRHRSERRSVRSSLTGCVVPGSMVIRAQ